MTEKEAWREISAEETAVIAAIITASRLPGCDILLAELDGAAVSPQTAWILDIKPADATRATDLPTGPFPARAFVPSSAQYQGEVIVWISAGHISGLEYAWITDGRPTRWPLPEEMEIVPS